MEDVRLVVLVGHPDTRADLSLIPEILDRIATQAEIERPVIVRRPLVLNPELLPVADQAVVRVDPDNRTGRGRLRIVRVEAVEPEESGLVDRLGSIDLKPRLNQMFL